MPTKKIQYASDIHLEFPQNSQYIKMNPLQPNGDILVLAGDIVTFSSIDKHKDFFSYVSDHFETTYWLPGNHEYYHFDAATKCGELNEAICSNVFLVNNTSVYFEDAKLIFSTLWSKISTGYQWQIERAMNDFHVIKYAGKRFSTDRYNQLHEESLAFIGKALQEKTAGKTFVFTHHVPTFLHYPPQYKGDILNEAFAVELHDIIEPSNINYWVYGHHHHPTLDFTIGNTRMLTNQLGYVQQHEHAKFDPGKSIEL